MADWRDRIKDPAYTSPVTKTRQEFKYKDLSLELEKKTTVYEFPESVKTYVQDLGVTGSRYPMICYFTGADCDIEADVFMSYLSERGVGVLEHPVYGVKNVTPVGTIKREDPRASGGNEVGITVVFYETINTVYPGAEVDASTGIQTSAAKWFVGSAEKFEKEADVERELDRRTLIDDVNKFIDDANEALKPLYDTFEDIQKGYNAISDSITRGLNTLVGQPATLMFQTSLLLQAPGQTFAALRDKLSGYANVLRTTVGGQPNNRNDFLYKDGSAGSSIAGVCIASTTGVFKTQEDAISYAVAVAELFDTYITWREEQAETFEVIDDPESYRALQETVALTIGNIIQTSFSLNQRFEITLNRDRNIVELEAELYGTIDENLDFLIESNSLSGKELLVVPNGKEIIYYASRS